MQCPAPVTGPACRRSGDSLLGIMRRYLAFSGTQPDGHFLRFKRLLMSYQIIFDGVRKRVWRGTASLEPFSMTPELEPAKPSQTP